LILVKEYIHKRDNNTCQWCGKKVSGSNCQVSHVIPVSANHGLSVDPLNMKILCYHCHLGIWHKNPILAYKWFKSKFPSRLRYLEKCMKDKVQLNKEDYLRLIEEWKLKIK